MVVTPRAISKPLGAVGPCKIVPRGDHHGLVLCNPPSTPRCTPGHSRQSSFASTACSPDTFAEAAETLLFIDWDDTLFPTAELYKRLAISRVGAVPQQVDRQLEPWRQALRQLLITARSLSDRCVILTNSRRPWIHSCVERFAPELAPLFEGRHGLRIVYAEEALKDARGKGASCFGRGTIDASGGSWLLSTLSWLQALSEDDAVHDTSLARPGPGVTHKKHKAMEQEAESFYSRYPGQTWKNIISIGDSRYEHDALFELCARRAGPPHEKLRGKAVMLPREPSLDSLTMSLRLTNLLLQEYVRFDGMLDINLQASDNPFPLLAEALCVPRLAGVTFSEAGTYHDAEEETLAKAAAALCDFTV